jgi:hypothetical protein
MIREIVNLIEFDRSAKALNGELEARLEYLRTYAAKIFLLDKDGNIVLVRRGKFLVPEFNKLYVILNLKQVMGFFSALVQYNLAMLKSEEATSVGAVKRLAATVNIQNFATANDEALAAGDPVPVAEEEIVPEVKSYVTKVLKSNAELGKLAQDKVKGLPSIVKDVKAKKVTPKIK